MLLSALFQKLQLSIQDSECRPLLQLLQQSSQSVHDAYICTDCKWEPNDFKFRQFFLLNSQWNFLVFLFDYHIQFEVEQVFQVLFFFRASSLKKRSDCGFFCSIFSKIAVFIRTDGPILLKIFRLNQLSYFRHFFRELALINGCLNLLA